jgi:hypothetical protein
LWVYSSPLALRGLWSSESYVASNRLPSLAPFASLAVSVSFRISSKVRVGSLTSWPFAFFFLRFATSLCLGPLSLVVLGLVSVMRFSSASELCSWLPRALPVAWFHPCSVTALSLDLLSPFEVSGFLCPAQVPEPRNFAFPTFGVSTLLGFLCTMEVDIPRCYPRGSPSLRFLPSTFLQMRTRFRSGLIVSPKGL